MVTVTPPYARCAPVTTLNDGKFRPMPGSPPGIQSLQCLRGTRKDLNGSLKNRRIEKTSSTYRKEYLFLPFRLPRPPSLRQPFFPPHPFQERSAAMLDLRKRQAHPANNLGPWYPSWNLMRMKGRIVSATAGLPSSGCPEGTAGQVAPSVGSLPGSQPVIIVENYGSRICGTD
jgi:hypothetical protein